MVDAARYRHKPTAPPDNGRGRPRVVETVRSRFRQRLGWRLTASYALVTVAVLVCIEAALLVVGGIWTIVVLGRTGDEISRDLEGRAAPALAPFLASPYPDLDGIDRWLRQIQSTGLVAEEDGPVRLRPDVSSLARSQTRLLVVDRDGNLAGAIKQSAVPTSGQPADFAELVGLDEAVASARAGTTTSTPVLQWPVPEGLIVAVPIRDDLGTIVGVIVFAGRTPLQSSVVALAQILGAIAIGSILFGAVIATISGYLAARILVVRFDRMSVAAAAWGEGDFTAAVADSAEDEIGQLGRRLDPMAEQLADLIRARQQLSVVAERNRLARDLHDSVKQQAFAVSMHLGTARELLARYPAGARLRLDASYDIARQSQQELTAIIQTLRPTELADATFDRALDEYLGQWQARTGISAQAKIAGPAPLPHPVEDALFRVAQEALTNVARHSRASRVEVSFGRDTGAVHLDIVDDGIGFEVRRPERGVGLQSMRERVEALGGTFGLVSGGGGTHVSVRIPLAEMVTEGGA